MPSNIRLQAVSSAVWLGVLVASLLIVLCAAPFAGLSISFELVPTMKAVGIAGVFALLA